MIMPFMRNEDDRRVILNASGRTWDGNQTWIVFAGGAIFVIWPVVYGSIFSGLYAAMLCILWSFFFRPPGFEYRSKIESALWRRFWDVGLFVSSFLPVLIFGVAFGNLLEGLPIYFDPITMRSFYDGNFWGLINWMGIIAGLVSITMLLMHGAAMLHRRTEGDLRRRMRRLFYIFAWLFLILFTGAGFMVAFAIKGYVLLKSPVDPTAHPLANEVIRQRGAWILSYGQHPWKAAFPIIAYIATFFAMLTMRIGKGGFAFWCSVFAIVGVIGTAGAALYPFVVPSSYKPSESMTIWNASSAQYTLNVMLYVSVVLFVFILLYKIFTYWSVWKDKSSLTIDDIKKNEHTFY